MVVLETFQEVEFLGTVFCPLFSPCGPVDLVRCPLLFVVVVIFVDFEEFSSWDHLVCASRIRMLPLFWHKLGLAFPGASMEFERIHVRMRVIVKQM